MITCNEWKIGGNKQKRMKNEEIKVRKNKGKNEEIIK